MLWVQGGEVNPIFLFLADVVPFKDLMLILVLHRCTKINVLNTISNCTFYICIEFFFYSSVIGRCLSGKLQWCGVASVLLDIRSNGR